MKIACDLLGIARSNIYERITTESNVRQRKSANDSVVLENIKETVRKRPVYGYRRVTAMLNKTAYTRINQKRVDRIMGENKLLLPPIPKKPTRKREGKIITLASDLRWCSDHFDIRCWNGDVVRVIFSLDCHDREAMRFHGTTGGITGKIVRDLMAETVEYRFPGVTELPRPLQWLSDNGPAYTARETIVFGRGLGFEVCTTPAYCPESNGMAEAFVKTFRRDYVYVNELRSAQTVLDSLQSWFDDYNDNAPHQGLKMRSPREFRSVNSNKQVSC
jgi:transposase InsO family protein